MDKNPLPENAPCPYIYNAPWNHPSNTDPKGESPIFRNMEYSKINMLRCYPVPDILTVKDIHIKNFSEIPSETFLGYRSIVNPKLGTHDKVFTWLKNSEYEQISKDLGAGI